MIQDGVIIRLTGKEKFLSNFEKCPVTYNGITYNCAECAFQAQKAPENERYKFINMEPKAAKLAGSHKGEYSMKEGSEELAEWERVHFRIMEEILVAKFTQNENLKKKLIQTYPMHIIEGVTWPDNIWGIPLAKKENKWPFPLAKDENGKYYFECEENENNNMLGKLLMKVREELRESE